MSKATRKIYACFRLRGQPYTVSIDPKREDCPLIVVPGGKDGAEYAAIEGEYVEGLPA